MKNFLHVNIFSNGSLNISFKKYNSIDLNSVKFHENDNYSASYKIKQIVSKNLKLNHYSKLKRSAVH